MTSAIAAATVSSAATTSSAASSTSSSDGTLAGNFQTFLTLLTTQLQNQNPLDPLDTNQFTQQLVQFAGVEQQLKTNDQLASLLTLQSNAQSTQALGFVGKTATVDGSSTTLENGAANWTLGVDSNATVDYTITNSAGQTVFTGKAVIAAGSPQTIKWDGKGTDGTQWPAGNYKITATAKDSSGNSVAVGTRISGVVTSVDLTQTPPLLTIGGQTYTMNQIRSIATTTTASSSSNPD